MNLLAAMSHSTLTLLLLGGAALLLYAAGRIAVGAVPARLDRSGVRAILGTLPVLIVVIVAVVMNHFTLALHLPIACAAATLTFGLSALIAGRTAPETSRANRSWALLVPAIVMLLIIAMGSTLDLAVIVSLVAYGAVTLLSWSPDAVDESETLDSPQVAKTTAAAALSLWITGMIAAGVAGVLGMYGTDQLSAVRGGLSSDSLVSVFLLAPAIVVPFFFEMLPPCRSIGWGGSISSLLKFALICLCFVLPLGAIGVSHRPLFATVLQSIMPAGLVASATPANGSTSAPATNPTSPVPSRGTTQSIGSAVRPGATQPTATRPAQAAEATLTPSPIVASFVPTYPSLPTLATRADLIVLTGVSLLLIPIAAGWLRPGRLEAFALLVCYVLNLLLVIGNSI